MCCICKEFLFLNPKTQRATMRFCICRLESCAFSCSIYLPMSLSPPFSPACCTGRYPSLVFLVKYFLLLNLFFKSLVKSRMSSPEVVCKE